MVIGNYRLTRISQCSSSSGAGATLAETGNMANDLPPISLHTSRSEAAEQPPWPPGGHRLRHGGKVGRRLQRKPLESLFRLPHGVGRQGRDVHCLDTDSLHIHDADEAEDLTQVRLEEIPLSPRAVREDAARGENENRLLVLR